MMPPPLTVSLLVTHVPLAYFFYDDTVMIIPLSAVILFGSIHHSAFNPGDMWHSLDRAACAALVLASAYSNFVVYNNTTEYWVCLAAVGACHASNLAQDNMDRSKRGWASLEHIRFHISMHVFSFLGIFSMIYPGYST